MYRAITRESGGAPTRIQTSNESSVSGGGFTESCDCTSTWGRLRTKREISGATWLRPKPSVALTLSSPVGVALATPSNPSIPSISLRMRRARSRHSSPSGVRLIRRVVRTTRATPRRDSIRARCLLTAGVVMPSSRAAALKLPALASAEIPRCAKPKKRSCEGKSQLRPVANSRTSARNFSGCSATLRCDASSSTTSSECLICWRIASAMLGGAPASSAPAMIRVGAPM